MDKSVQKDFLYVDGEAKTKTFEELHEDFFNMIQSEKWKLLKKYGSKLDALEVEQQFTIELWNAYNQYEIEKGVCISTYIYNKFRKARRDLLFANMLSKKSQFEKENITYMQNTKENSESEDTNHFSNKEFEHDETYMQYKRLQPDLLLEENELFKSLLDLCEHDYQKDLMFVIIDRKNYTVADYAEKWNISRMAANKRTIALIKKLKEFLGEDIYG